MTVAAGRAMCPFAAASRGGDRWMIFVIVLAFAVFVSPAYSLETSTVAPLAARALLLDVANTGDKLVAVGDHGNVVISHDNGLTWTQSIAPTQVLLTAVSFPDSQHGWAVGHEGVIITTTDGGQTWHRQDDGKNIETVFLDVRFLNPSQGFAVGAYGKFLKTADGGKNWTAAKPIDEEMHYNRLSVGTDGALYLAGESGTLLLSRDNGKKWSKAEVPYDGSLFGALPLDGESLVVYGLRGHIFHSDDRGVTWEPQNSEIKVLITCGIRLKTGTILLGGQGGNFFVSRDAGHAFESWKMAGFSSSVAAMVEADDGAVITVGEAGATRVKVP
jgi:photosystem II stability/assembly factor-like uncharacterized protein